MKWFPRPRRRPAATQGRSLPGTEILEHRRLLSAVRIGDVGPAYARGPGTTVSDGTFAYYLGHSPGEINTFGVWKTDGTAAGTARLATLSHGAWVTPGGLTLANGKLFLTAADDDSYGAELYSVDLATGAVRNYNLAPTSQYHSVADLVELNGQVYVTTHDAAGYGLYATDGTPAGTRKVFDLGASSFAFRPDVARVGNELWFSAGGGGNSWTVYRSDGTPAGTRVVDTVTGSAVVRDFAKIGDKVVFNAFNVWVSDGTEAGTAPLSHPGGLGMYSAGDFAVFYGDRQSVWVTDGTEAGTRAVPGLFATEGYLPFTTAVNGRVIVPGGTIDGTGIHAVTPAGSEFLFKDDVSAIFKAGDRVYFDGRFVSHESMHRTAHTDGTYDGTWLLDDPPPPGMDAGKAFGFTKVAGGVIYDFAGLYFLPDDAPRVPGYSGHVFRDLDADGVYDPGEPRENLAELPYIPVADDGSWSARFAPAGPRTLIANPTAEYVRPTTPSRIDFTLAPGERRTGLDFGFRRVNIVRGSVRVDPDRDRFVNHLDAPAQGHTVFADLDRDGVADPTEPADVTGADGAFELDDLPAGGVLLRLVPAAGWYISGPAAPGIEVATSTEGGVFADRFFAVDDKPPANYIGAGVFDDANRNGVRDPGEGRRGGAVVYVDLDDDSVRDAGEPFGTQGDNILRVTRPGTYAVRVEPPAGWVSTAPAPRITLAPGEWVFGVEIPVAVPAPQGATLAGVAFNDADGDGSHDPAELPRIAVRVYLDHDDDFTPDAGEPFTLTDALGRFAFVNLAPGHYRVRQEIVDPQWYQTTPPPGAAIEADLAAGEQRTDLLLGARRAQSADLRKIVTSFFLDADADGVKDPGEGLPPQHSFSLYVDANNNAVYENGERFLQTITTTTSNLSSFAPGRYRLRAATPSVGGLRVSNFGPDGSLVVNVDGTSDPAVQIGLYRPNIQVTDAWYESHRLPRQVWVKLSDWWPQALQAITTSARVTREDGGEVPSYTVQAAQPPELGIIVTFAGGDLPAGRYTLTIPGSALQGSAALPTPPDYTFTFTVPPPPSAVVGRHVFTNRSSIDGNSDGANARDDDAIVPGKSALLPGQTAGYANVTSYSRGLNGVMIDIAGLPRGTTPDAGDFSFRAGNTPDVSGWEPLATQPRVFVRPGAGTGGSDRVTLIWLDNAIRNTWLEVTVKATPDTGLSSPDVFYFGNLVGDAGGAGTGRGALVVDASDVAGARAQIGRPLTAAARAAYDFNRDGRVDNADALLARQHQGRRLATFTAPAAPPSAPSAASAPPPARISAPRRRAWDDTPPDELIR